jgi:hypothetical protein
VFYYEILNGLWWIFVPTDALIKVATRFDEFVVLQPIIGQNK